MKRQKSIATDISFADRSVSVHEPFVNTFISLTNEHEQGLVLLRFRSIRLKP
ncbi:hypothetical protein HanRHA438_Chr12g0555181 [Helianthus annuus]|nr:hypothetical protein HanIR_Chr12g0586281 [Helianthus annuus]KAJ0866739.1 hypothetical protein HanRHA438_Chr12g0555181 [Helianthus annuus]